MARQAIVDMLLVRACELEREAVGPVRLLQNDSANALVTDLEAFPHGFVLACLMDRQMSSDRCWMIPHEIRKHTGQFSFDTLETFDEAYWMALFVKHNLHRYKHKMAVTWHRGIQHISALYNGDASRIWSGVPGSATLVRRFLEFSGCGPKIATMAANILVREFRVPVSDRFSIDVSVDIHVRRVFRRLELVPAEASDDIIVYTARELNPEYPGILDFPAWEMGTQWCHPTRPNCTACYLDSVCPKTAVRD